MTEMPIACTLSPGEQRARLAEMAALARDALVSRTDVPHGQRLAFTAGGDVEARLRDIAAAETQCCPFLRFDVAARDGAVVLTVTGPDGAAPVIAELFA